MLQNIPKYSGTFQDIPEIVHLSRMVLPGLKYFSETGWPWSSTAVNSGTENIDLVFSMFSSTSTSSGTSASSSTSTSRTACASTSTSNSKVAGNTWFVCFVNSDLRYVFSLCSTIYFTIFFNSMSLFTIITRPSF